MLNNETFSKSLGFNVNNIIFKQQGVILNINSKKIKLISIILKLCSFYQYTQLLDIWAIDNINNSKTRFCIYYMILSLFKFQRIYITCKINQINNLKKIDSLYKIFASTNFLEREVWDLFGIVFLGHPDLRKLLTDYGFTGFPLRKDFPLTGFQEIKYNINIEKLNYQPVKFFQAYRLYSFEKPW